MIVVRNSHTSSSRMINIKIPRMLFRTYMSIVNSMNTYMTYYTCMHVYKHCFVNSLLNLERVPWHKIDIAWKCNIHVIKSILRTCMHDLKTLVPRISLSSFISRFKYNYKANYMETGVVALSHERGRLVITLALEQTLFSADATLKSDSRLRISLFAKVAGKKSFGYWSRTPKLL